MTDRAPLLWIAVFFSAGIFLAWRFNPPLRWLWVCCGTAVAVSFFCRGGGRVLLLLCLSLLVGAVRAGQDAKIRPDSLARRVCAEPGWIACEGSLLSSPQWVQGIPRVSRRTAWFRADRLLLQEGEERIDSRLLVWLPAEGGHLYEGDSLLLRGWLRKPAPSKGKGFDEGNWFWLHHADGLLVVAGGEGIRRLSRSGGIRSFCMGKIDRFRQFLQRIGRISLDPKEAGYLEALVLGKGEGIPQSDWDLFRATGTVHLLVVSGLQVGIIGFVLYSVLSFVPFPRTARFLMVGAGLAGYCLLAGASIPVLRATLTGILVVAGKMTGYPVSPLNSVGLAALLLLWWDPRALGSVSFQLSFAAVTGLIVCARLVKHRLWRFPAVSLGCWAATAPFIGWHFGLFTPVAVPANLLVVPYVSVLTVFGFLVYLSGWLVPALAGHFESGYGFLLQGLMWILARFSSLPGGCLRV